MTSAKKAKPDDASTPRGNIGTLIYFIVPILIASVPFAAGKYMELLRDGPFDGALNAYAAQAILDGGKIGVDILPSARPATLMVNIVGVAIFGYSEVGPKLIQMMMQLVGLALLYTTLRRLYGTAPAGAALILASLFLSYPLFAKYGNVKEQFMVASAMIAAFSLLRGALSRRWWWYLVSGAAAINVHYFKPTGDAVWIAMAVFMVAQLVVDKAYRFKPFFRQVGLLLLGALIGIMPLLILFGSHGKLNMLTSELPRPAVFKRIFSSSSAEKNADDGEVENATEKEQGGSSYLEASRQVSDFGSQYEWVMQYYTHLVVPISLGLTAVGIFIVRLFRRRRCAVNVDDSAVPPLSLGCVEAMLVVWWILDMIFVWVSPRSYVEYFLPLNASGAALSAIVFYHSRRHLSVFVGLLAVCGVVYALVHCLVPSSSLPYLTWRSEASLPIGGTVFYVIALLCVALLCFLPKLLRHQPRLRYGVSLGATLVVLFIWTKPVIADFNHRVSQLHENRVRCREQLARVKRMPPPPTALGTSLRQAQLMALQECEPATWKIVGHFIGENSTAEDRIYVWGWFPGIYVTAQRFAPVPIPAYSDMHTTPPQVLEGIIKGLVDDFQKHPPKYIVDSQKMHFPYYSHPLFDLWPRMRVNNKQVVGFDLKVMPTPDKGNTQLLPPNQLDQASPMLLRAVEEMTYAMLTRQDRKGGPLPEKEAREKASQEAERHRAMQPLREFVMKHYRLVPLSGMEMYIFQYQPSDRQ